MKAKRVILGVGLDCTDGHKRILRADDAVIVGGSQETHERMAETYIKTSEALQRKGRSIQTADPREIADLLREHSPRP